MYRLPAPSVPPPRGLGSGCPTPRVTRGWIVVLGPPGGAAGGGVGLASAAGGLAGGGLAGGLAGGSLLGGLAGDGLAGGGLPDCPLSRPGGTMLPCASASVGQAPVSGTLG